MKSIFLINLLLVLLASCNENGTSDQTMMSDEEQMEELTPAGEVEVTEVSFTKSGDDYTFSVRLKSPDTGCDQYANWWEVITDDGNLVYRRILGHSHVTEQPFTRSGGPVSVDENQELIIRGHMNNSGYGPKVFRGSITSGFERATIDKDFAEDLKEQQPLPTNCAF